jgi:hypothetical protein
MSAYSNLFPTPFNADDPRPLPELIATGNPDPADGWPDFPLQYHEIEGVRYYAVQDWILGVAQTDNARSFWQRMKARLKKAKITLFPPCTKLPYFASNGNYYQLDFAPATTIWMITMSMGRSTGIVSRVLGYRGSAEKSKRIGCIYFIGLKGLPHYIKIGKTSDVQKRISEIGTNIPFEVILLHAFTSNCPSETEYLLHKHFQQRRIRREWFQLSQSDIETLMQLNSDADVAEFVGDQAAQASKRLGIDLITNKPLLKKGDE